MLFDLLKAANDLGCQMESLLSNIQQQQQQQRVAPTRPEQANSGSNQSAAAANATSPTNERAGGVRSRLLAACRPLDLSLKPSSCEPPKSSRESRAEANLNEDAPLNLVKSEHSRGPLASSSPASSSSSLYSFSNASIFHSSTCGSSSSSSSSSSASSPSTLSCDNNLKAECDNNNNNNNNNHFSEAQQRESAARLEELRQCSADVQISSTNGRAAQSRRRCKKLASKGPKSHLCEHCGRSFSRSDMLTRHSRLHSGLKPYQCAKCLQVFSRSDHLSTHERTHTGEKPYQCRFCSYSACRRDMITRHMRTHTMGRLGGGGGAKATRRRPREPTNKRNKLASCQAEDNDDVSTSSQIGLPAAL